MAINAEQFSPGRVKQVTDSTVVTRIEEMRRSFRAFTLQQQALRLLGSEIIFAREVPDTRGCWVALVRFGRIIESSLALNREVMAFFTPHADLQLRDYARLPQLRESLPRQPNEDIYLISSPDPRAAAKLQDWTIREPFSALCLPRPNLSAEEAAEQILTSLSDSLAARNLYEETLPVTGSDFFGRRSMLVDLTDNLRQGKVCGVFGLRKTGKTSLITELGRQFVLPEGEQRIFVLRDLENLPSEPREHPTKLQADLTASLLPKLRELKLRTHELANLSPTSSLSEFRRALQGTLGHSSARNAQVVVALDEIESLVGHDATESMDHQYVPEFFGMLRSIVQEYPNFNVILAGLTSSVLESGILCGRENPLFAWARPYYVPPLERAEADSLILQLGRRMALFWGRGALDAVYENTDGHVFLLRTLCTQVAAAAPRKSGSRTADEILVRSVLRSWRRSVSEQVRQMTLSLERFYPDASTLLNLFQEQLIDEHEADESYPSELNQLLKLGLLSEDDSTISLTAFSRLAARA